MFDVAVVGGGPSGSMCATVLSEKGYRVALFEEHQSPGFPMQCGGLISEDCLKILKKYVDADKFLLNRIDGAYFFSPSGKHVKLRGKSKAVVIDRKIVDLELFKLAALNSKTFVKKRVRSVSFDEKFVIDAGEKFESSYVIGADGPYSVVAKCLSFNRPEFLSAIQVECEFESLDEKYVELYFGYSDCMFAYSIPCGDGFSRIGVVSKNNAIFWLKKLLREHPSVSKRVEFEKNCELNCGTIPLGLIDFVKGKALLIGDSAGMVKPYTGGGMYYLSIAVELLAKYFPNLEEFKRKYLNSLRAEYEVGKRIFRLYGELSKEDYDYLVKIAEKIDFSNFHMDKPSSILNAIPHALNLLKRPSLALKIVKCLLS